jgi:type I restriction enzyme S subunit
MAGELPLAKVGDISRAVRAGHQGFIAPLNYITRAEALELRARVFPRGSTVFAKIGEAIAQNFRLFTDREVALDNNTMGAIPRKGIEPRYLFRFLQTVNLYAYSSKTTVPSVRKSELERIPIPIPPLPEQRRIADILDKADAIRRKRKEAIALTEELLRSAFLEMFGDPVTNPKGWDVKPLGELADIASGVTKGKKYDGRKLVTVPYMRVANVQDGHLVLDDVAQITVSENEASRYLLRRGDVLLTEGGDPDKLGRGAVWHGEVADCIHQNHIFRVRAREDLLPDYLSALVASQRGKRYFLRAAKQTTGIASINMTQLKAFPALVPPRELQVRYLACAEMTRRARDRQSETQRELDVLFENLSRSAFRGELIAS